MNYKKVIHENLITALILVAAMSFDQTRAASQLSETGVAMIQGQKQDAKPASRNDTNPLKANRTRTSFGSKERADKAIADQANAAGLDPFDPRREVFEPQRINVAVDPDVRIMSVAPVPSPSLSYENAKGERIDPIPVENRVINFAKMEYVDQGGGVFLSGVRPTHDIYFYLNRDEIAQDATVRLSFTPSPSLIPVVSQLNVYLNHSLQITIPIVKETLGHKTEISFKLNPLLLRDHNAITLEFRGSYSEYCTNPLSSTLWLSVGADSALTMHIQKLRMADDLAFFPLPFINAVTPDPTVLSAVFPEKTDADMIRAASVFASYAGLTASWRGVNCHVFKNALPATGHAIVFITNDERPEFLKDYPRTKVPEIEIRPVSSYGTEKMLIINAPDSKGLVSAVRALISGQILLNGPVAKIKKFTELKAREAYDAPKWVKTSQPTKFADLQSYDGQLSRTAIRPAPISLELNLPPDLYFVQGSRVNLDLHFKYSRPAPVGVSQMQFLLNNHLVRSYPLKSDSETSAVLENLPFIGGIDLFSGSKVDTLLLHPQNLLTFDFQYALTSESRVNYCVTQTLINNSVEIDPSSTIDFSGTYHFAKMPNLGLFWQSSYPFSIYADMSRTAAVLDKAGSAEIAVLMNFMARTGRLTGASAQRLNVYLAPSEKDFEKIKDLDLLVIGKIPDALSLDDNAHTVINGNETQLASRREEAVPSYNTDGEGPDFVTSMKTSEGLSSMISFRSPLSSDRTVVALSYDSDAGAANLCKKLAFEQGLGFLRGSSAVIRDDSADCSDPGEIYYVGDLPWYQRLWYSIMTSGPITLILLSLLAAALFCWMLYRILRAIRRSRLLEGREDR